MLIIIVFVFIVVLMGIFIVVILIYFRLLKYKILNFIGGSYVEIICGILLFV